MEQIKEEQYEETEEVKEIETLNAIESLISNLIKKRDEAVEFRAASGIERMWREDDAAFDGGDGYSDTRNMIEYATGEAYIKQGQGPKRSQVVVNVIRSKCETAEGRFSEILLPVDDRNYELKETPVPEIANAIKDDADAVRKDTGEPVIGKDGKPMKMADVARNDLNAIKEKMLKMQAEVDDQLTESKYNAEQRKLIKDAIRTGTGIIKGPNNVKRIKKVWLSNNGQFEMQSEEEIKPSSETVSCWDIYPDADCGEDIHKAAHIWESDNIRPQELRDLYGVPGYLDKQIIKVLQEPPIRLRIAYDTQDKRHKIKRLTTSQGDLYEKWTYSGEINREDLEAMGIELEGNDIAQSFSGIVVFCNDHPIKVQLNVLDSGDLPYDFFQWTTVRDSPWGIGIPRMMSWLQRILNATWRAMMDNAGDSSGVNIVVGSGVQPVDGVWEITGKKIWKMMEDSNEDGDARKAFQQFQISNNQADLEKIIELVLKFIDLETSIPTIFQGEQQKVPETLGATNIMVDAHNVGLRGRVKRYDDQITVPHLTRYYHWNMQYNKNDEIKGDYNVNPRGVSALFQKDQQAQTLTQVMAFKQDPDINLIVDWEKAARQMFRGLKLDILKSEDDYEKAKKEAAEAEPQQDPRIQAAQINAETTIKKAEMDRDTSMQTIQAKREQVEKELGLKAAEAEKDRQHEALMKSYDRDIKMMEYAEKRNIGLDKIKSELSKESMRLKTQMALTDKDGKASGGIAEPVVEPIGKAPDGESYTK